MNARARHGHAVRGAMTPEYSSWSSMKRRCLSPGCSHYAEYGGRGIRVCERWLTFENFLADMGPRPSRKYSLDRIDNDGHYEPGNVRWATRTEQLRNQRRNRMVTYAGETMCVGAWAERTGLSWHTIVGRLDCGWPAEKALTMPPVGRIGANNPASRLTESDVREIRRRRASGEAYTAIAPSYGVSDVTIRNVCVGRVWGHVADAFDGSRAEQLSRVLTWTAVA